MQPVRGPARATPEADATRAMPRVDGPPVSAPERPMRGQPVPPNFTTGGRRRRFGGWRAVRWTLLALLLVVAITVGLVFVALSRVAKVDALRDYSGRPAATPGQDWLLVGSDSRGGLSDSERRHLHLGAAAGQRTDTIILLHTPSGGGGPTMVSLPRDSYVSIPGHGRNKLNAAYAFGGPALLVRTVEQATGIRIDHYAEIGFGGFVGVTDSVGGVQLCPKTNINDDKSGLDVKKGCQQMDGRTALAYVRARYFDPKGDLGRVERQQEYLSAVFHRATSPAVVLNPFRVVQLANKGANALAVDKGDGAIDLLRLGLAMHAISGGKGRSVTVPVSDPAYSTPAGSAVKWDSSQASALFRSLR
jgi:LCP family protein required for cell wall assembly